MSGTPNLDWILDEGFDQASNYRPGFEAQLIAARSELAALKHTIAADKAWRDLTFEPVTEQQIRDVAEAPELRARAEGARREALEEIAAWCSEQRRAPAPLTYDAEQRRRTLGFVENEIRKRSQTPPPHPTGSSEPSVETVGGGGALPPLPLPGESP